MGSHVIALGGKIAISKSEIIYYQTWIDELTMLSLQAACKTGDAACFCAAKGSSGTYADTATGCKNYYECVSSTQAYYRSCPTGLIYNQVSKNCDYTKNVNCKSTGPSSSTRRPPPPKNGKSPKPPSNRPPPPRLTSPPTKPTPSPAPTTSPPSNPKYRFVGYYQSWSDPWVGTASDSRIANLPSYVNIVVLSFMKPDSTYSLVDMTFTGTGIEFSSTPQVVKSAIALLKQRNPGTKVLVAVGGATYTNWNAMNTNAIVSFIKDFCLDGVDIDYEPSNPNCQASGGKVTCATDAEYIGAVRGLHAVLPSTSLLTTAAWSIGAYGVGAYVNSQPQGQYTGVAVNMLNSVGSLLNMVFIMSYDAGITYDPKEAFNAYTALYKGDVMLGVEVAKEASGDHVISINEVNSLAEYVKSKNGAGMTLWSLQEQNTAGPTADSIGQAACTSLGLTQCSCPLISAKACS